MEASQEQQIHRCTVLHRAPADTAASSNLRPHHGSLGCKKGLKRATAVQSCAGFLGLADVLFVSFVLLDSGDEKKAQSLLFSGQHTRKLHTPTPQGLHKSKPVVVRILWMFQVGLLPSL